MELIEIEKLSLGYDKQVIIKNLNIVIEENDFICVVGANGSGKSTFIKSLLGLIKPMKGKIIFKNLSRNFIGYMPQENKVDQNFPASVMEIVLSGTLNNMGYRPFYSKREYEIAEKNLKLLKIDKLKNKSFRDLSGGERQKVLLARSLSATTKLLILDEPSNNLDINSRKDLFKAIKTLNEKYNITIIMVTHDLDHDNLIGNKILSLREEEIFFGSTEEFVRRIHNE